MSEFNGNNPFEDVWEGGQTLASAPTPAAPQPPKPASAPTAAPTKQPAPAPEAPDTVAESLLDLGSEDTETAPDFLTSLDDEESDDAPALDAEESVDTTEDDDEQTSQDEPETAAPPQDEEIENPLEAAIIAQETSSIFAALPVFEYAAATEPIDDLKQTFDALRVAKAADFPELEDANRVTWTVTYGKIVKTVSGTDAKKKKIGEFKASLESSKEFMDALKKSKDKNPRCVLKPSVRAQSKGKVVSAYKGIYADVEEAAASGMAICIFPARDGRVYEMRTSEIGTFTTPTDNCIELSSVRAGFIPALPLIPWSCLQKIICFFREQLREDGNYEALANILWDKDTETFVTYIPQQIVTRGTVVSDLSDMPNSKRYLHYMDIHSHNTMPAKFSEIDDADEKATRVYAVIGRLDSFMPDISVRISNGGKYLPIDPMLVFEQFDSACPPEWSDRVTIRSREEVCCREV